VASHTEIKVGDTDWVIRIGGEDVQVKVLEKTRKASGRGYEFRCKRFKGGRSVGRNLVRGSGALRRAGEPVRASGFTKNGSSPSAPAPRTRAKPKSRAKPKPRARASTSYLQNPPASAFFSEVQEPGAPRSATASSSSAGGRLGSLRGRGRANSKPAPARQEQSPSAAKREIEKQIKHAGVSDLVADLVKALIRCDGTEHSAQQVYATVMSEHRMRGFGVSFRR
jgi:hypothetical protein